jgi:hypothetical protein
MFGELIEQVQELVEKLVERTETRSRVRARYLAASQIYAGLLVTNEVGGYADGPEGQAAEQTLMNLSLSMALKLEATVYLEECNEGEDDL